MESTTQKAKKYLSVQVCGKNGLKFNCFPNMKKKENPKAPDFFSLDGCAVWINEQRQKPQDEFVGGDEVFS